MRFDDFGGIDSLKRLNESIVLHNLTDRMNLLVSGFPSLPVDVVCLPELTDIRKERPESRAALVGQDKDQS